MLAPYKPYRMRASMAFRREIHTQVLYSGTAFMKRNQLEKSHCMTPGFHCPCVKRSQNRLANACSRHGDAQPSSMPGPKIWPSAGNLQQLASRHAKITKNDSVLHLDL